MTKSNFGEKYVISVIKLLFYAKTILFSRTVSRFKNWRNSCLAALCKENFRKGKARDRAAAAIVCKRCVSVCMCVLCGLVRKTLKKNFST